ncbi:hypothetical protein VNI00_009003 [Paramarasmius palmivorus]|uniref:F-box domain-containing protein n=1 Tax=Paramarasmius palmivorus TaxID=297713 RepID=A0AAW0CP12_9AGAR
MSSSLESSGAKETYSKKVLEVIGYQHSGKKFPGPARVLDIDIEHHKFKLNRHLANIVAILSELVSIQQFLQRARSDISSPLGFLVNYVSTGQRNRTTLCARCNDEFISEIVYPSIDATDRLQPLDSKRSQAFIYLDAEERDLACYEAELARLQRIVHKLEAEKSALERRIHERRSWTSAMRKFPSEIWCLIFEEACSSNPYTLDIPRTSSNQLVKALPLVLSRVSSQWRDILHEYPQLWSALSVDIQSATKELDSLVQYFLRRSGTIDLKLHIDDSKESPFGHRTEQNLGRYGLSILHRLIEVLPRCKELKLSIRGDVIRLVSSLMYYNASFMSLEKLEMKYEVDMSATRFWDLIQNATKLRHVTIPSRERGFRLFDIMQPDTTPPNSKIPYHQLTSINFQSSPPSVILHALRYCTGLVSMRCDGWNPAFARASALSTPVAVPNLRYLFLSDVYIPSLHTLFRSIILPSITTVTIADFLNIGPDKDWTEMSRFGDMLERSKASLKNLVLRIAHWRVPLAGLLHILQLSPELTTLEVSVVRHNSEPNFVPNLLSRLTVQDASVPLVAKLQRLCIREVVPSDKWSTVPSPVAQKLVTLAESRFAHTVSGGNNQTLPLVDLQISFSDDWCDEAQYEDQPLSFDAYHLEERWGVLRQGGMHCMVLWQKSIEEEDPLPSDDGTDAEDE